MKKMFIARKIIDCIKIFFSDAEYCRYSRFSNKSDYECMKADYEAIRDDWRHVLSNVP